MNPFFSIITPSYNQGMFLEKTIQSVLNQSYENYEYLIIDGGSTDDSVDIIKKYQDQLDYWISEPDRGHAHAVNKGLKKAQGEWIAYLNSDDVYHPNALQNLAHFLQTNHQVDMIYGKATCIDSNDNNLGDYPTETWNLDRLAENCFICQPSVFVKRSVLEEVGGFDESVFCSIDYDAWLKIGKKFKVYYLDQYIASTRIYSETLSAKYEKKIILENIKVSRRHMGYAGREWYISYYQYKIKHSKNKILRWLWSFILECHQNMKSCHPTYHQNPIGLIRYWFRKIKNT